MVMKKFQQGVKPLSNLAEAWKYLFNSIRNSILPNEVQQSILSGRQVDGALGRGGHDVIGTFSSESPSSLKCEEYFRAWYRHIGGLNCIAGAWKRAGATRQCLIQSPPSLVIELRSSSRLLDSC
jgi:hypothetical protein